MNKSRFYIWILSFKSFQRVQQISCMKCPATSINHIDKKNPALHHYILASQVYIQNVYIIYTYTNTKTYMKPQFQNATNWLVQLTRDFNQATLEADSSRNASLELSWHQSPTACSGGNTWEITC